MIIETVTGNIILAVATVISFSFAVPWPADEGER